MADNKKTVATEAIGQSISVRDSMDKERVNSESVEVGAAVQRDNSVSQDNVASEKIISDQDGAVTRTQANINTVSGNGNAASTKYNDVSSTRLKGSEEDQEGLEMPAIK